MTGTAIGKQKFKVEIPFDDGSDENCLVSIEGTNLDLVKYLQIIVYSTINSYYYNGIPEELKQIKKIRMNDVHISFKNKKIFKWAYNSLYASTGIITLKASRSLL